MLARKPLLIATLTLLSFALSAQADEVRAYEKDISIPTWEIGPPRIHSVFPDAGRDIYPYTLQDDLTENKINKTYNGVFLENEYIQLLILPEIGGRLHGALDKTNDYVWLYWQRTIKPGLVGMTGAWISGGIEWNFPDGHRPSGFMPVDHRIVKHDDGSATVWVGETEPIYRMRWVIGMTVFPGRSYVRCDYIFANPTNHKNPFQFWATSATHANEWTQAQYPGDIVTGHGKHRFWHWPVHDGVDLTWWKNSPNASSYFAYDNPNDWFGTYDHRAQGGMIHVANHYVMPGKKLWTWGSGPSGRIWEDILTEGGGPYFEPQAGAWSDNQPDYHWMWPNEVKTVHDYWYPVRDTKGVRNANKDFAINLDVQDHVAFIAAYSTSVAENVTVNLHSTKTDRVLSEQTVTISPDDPYTAEVPIAEDTTTYDLRLTVYDSNRNVAIEFQSTKPREIEFPEPHQSPGDPKKMNQDELVHAGEWFDKFKRTDQALVYYREALEKDPKDSRANIEMGFFYLKQGKWNEALEHLNAALDRDPDNSRVYFGKAIAYAGLLDFDEAYNQFYRATYTYDYYSSAYLNLARIDLRRFDYQKALDKLAEAETHNGKLADIPALQAAACRRLNDHDKAYHFAERALTLDPMHFMGGYERLLALREVKKDASAWRQTWEGIMRGEVQNYLELAVSYANAGLYDDADSVLELFSTNKTDAEIHPMVNYFRGYFHHLRGNADAARTYFKKAQQGPVNYTNPHRLEGKAALEQALSEFPDDAHAHLFLGNLLYARGQREDGFSHWEAAVKSDDSLFQAWRNVGYGERHLKNDLKAAYDAYEKVLSINPGDSVALLEFDQIAERLSVPVNERLKVLQNREESVRANDDLSSRFVDLHLAVGTPESLEQVYQILKNHHFHSWEGKYGIHHAWVDVNQKLGDLAFDKTEFDKALHHYQEACTYPKNLEVAPRTPDFRAHVYWNLAKVYIAMNKPDRANEYLEKIIAEEYTKPHLGTYYQALAEKALGHTDRYQELLDSLHEHAERLTSGEFRYRGTPEAIGHYLLSLTWKEKGDPERSSEHRQKAFEQRSQVRESAIREAQLDIAQAHQ